MSGIVEPDDITSTMVTMVHLMYYDVNSLSFILHFLCNRLLVAVWHQCLKPTFTHFVHVFFLLGICFTVVKVALH